MPRARGSQGSHSGPLMGSVLHSPLFSLHGSSKGWTITSGLDALSSHVVVSVGADRDAVLWRLLQLLQDRFGIDHATLQVVEQRSDRVQRDQSQQGLDN